MKKIDWRDVLKELILDTDTNTRVSISKDVTKKQRSEQWRNDIRLSIGWQLANKMLTVDIFVYDKQKGVIKYKPINIEGNEITIKLWEYIDSALGIRLEIRDGIGAKRVYVIVRNEEAE